MAAPNPSPRRERGEENVINHLGLLYLRKIRNYQSAMWRIEMSTDSSGEGIMRNPVLTDL